jgi:hypothetical protein
MGGMTLGTGSGGKGDPPKKPTAPSKDPKDGKKSQREKEIERAEAIRKETYKNMKAQTLQAWGPGVKKMSITVKGLKAVQQILLWDPECKDLFKLRQNPGTMERRAFGNPRNLYHYAISERINPYIPIRPNHERLVGGRYSFDANAGKEYLMTLLASVMNGRETVRTPCTSCQGNNRATFDGCYRLAEVDEDGDETGRYFFKGACFNCAYGNQYGRCNLSSHVSQSRGGSQAQTEQGVQQPNQFAKVCLNCLPRNSSNLSSRVGQTVQS